MSGLIGELFKTSNALNAQSAGIATAGKNMANVNNKSYSRESVVFGDRGTVETTLGPQSLGIEALGYTQVRNSLLDSQIVRETSTQSKLQAQVSAFENAQSALGQQVDTQSTSSTINGSTTSTSGNQGIAEGLNDFFNSFSALSSDPTSGAQKQDVISKTQILTQRMNTVDQRLGNLQSDLSDQINSDVQSANADLSEISSLNKQIAQFEVGKPGSALDLRDQRQAKLEDLAKYMNISVQNVGNAGQITISSQDASGNPVVLLNSGNPPQTITFDGTNFTVAAPAATLKISSGSLAANLDARDNVVGGMRSDLNKLASQLVTTVNGIYNPGGTSTNFFDASGITAGTIKLDSTLTATSLRATNSTDAGANDVALAIAGAASTKFSTASGDQVDGTFGDAYRNIVSGIATKLSSANSSLSDENSVQSMLSTRRDSVSGVSIDEEMANLLKYQRAFQASAKVMSTVDGLLDTVVNGIMR